MLASIAVRAAYREAAIIAISDTLSPEMLAEGLARLNSFIGSLFGAEIGEQLSDWPLPSNSATAPTIVDNMRGPYGAADASFQPSPQTPQAYAYQSTPPTNTRVLWGAQTDGTVYLPWQPDDGSRIAVVSVGSLSTLTVSGNGRLVNGLTSLVLAPGFLPVMLFYRADLANWITIAPLLETDNLPLPPEFDDLIITGTAVRLTSLDEIKPQSGTLQTYARLLKRASQRYAQRHARSPRPDLPNSTQTSRGGAAW